MTEPKDTIDAAGKTAHTVGQMPSGNLALVLTTAVCLVVIWMAGGVLRDIAESVEKSADAMEKIAENDVAETELFREFVDVMTEREK